MREKLKQVALTYITRPTWVTWLLLFGWAILLISMIRDLKSSVPQDGQSVWFFFYASYLAVAPYLFAFDQLRWQFANPWSRLTPGFAAPHLIVWCLLSALLLIALPIFIAIQATASMAIVLAISGFIAAIFAYPNLAMAILILFILCSSADLDRRIVDPWIAGEGYRQFVLLGIAVASWTDVGRRVLRITVQREDDAGYEPPMWERTSARTVRPLRTAKNATLKGGGAIVAPRTTASIDRALRKQAYVSNWRRLGFVMRQPIESNRMQFWSVAPIGILIAWTAWQNRQAIRFDDELWGHLVSILPIVALALGLMPGVSLASHLPQMASERLLPMSNQSFVDALLKSVGWPAAKYWLLTLLLAGVATYALSWQGLNPPAVSTSALYVALSVTGLMFTFGVAITCAAFPNLLSVFLAGLAGFAATLGLQTYWWSLRTDDERMGIAIVWTLVCGVLGAFFIGLARNVWREKELG